MRARWRPTRLGLRRLRRVSITWIAVESYFFSLLFLIVNNIEQKLSRTMFLLVCWSSYYLFILIDIHTLMPRDMAHSMPSSPLLAEWKTNSGQSPHLATQSHLDVSLGGRVLSCCPHLLFFLFPVAHTSSFCHR